MPRAATIRPERVARCRKPGHRKHVAGCTTCRAFSTYEYHLRVWEKAHGISRLVPIGPAQEHLRFLVNEGNRLVCDIANEVSLPSRTVSVILTGGEGRQSLLSSTAEALLAVQPREEPKPPKTGLVLSIEGARILQGLTAQGWPWGIIGDLLGGVSRERARMIALGTNPWMFPATLDRIRAVARELGPYDINRLDKPMPGMDRNAANAAHRKGYVPLWRWNPDRLADPAAGPEPLLYLVDPADDDEAGRPAGDVLPGFVDPVVVRQVRETAEKLDATTGDLGRRADAYIRPLAGITRLEMYVVVLYGTQLGMSAADVAELLHYPARTGVEVETGQRAVCRILEDVRAAQGWIDKHCPGWIPRWFTYRPGDGKNSFGPLFTALLALQPAPIGPGWDVAELTERCRVTDDEMAQLLHRATTIGNRPWAPRAARHAATSHAA